MRIIANELKKIWNVKTLIIIALLSTLFFTSMSGYLMHYPRGTWLSGVDFAHHLTERYGTTLKREDFEDFLNYREVIVEELNPFFQSNTLLAQAGIFNYNDLDDLRQDFGMRYDTLSDEERSLLHLTSLELGYIVRTEQYGDLVSVNETPIAYIKMRSFSNIVGLYQSNILGDTTWGSHIDSFIQHSPLSERETRRLIEIRDSGELLNIMDQDTIFIAWRYGLNLAILIILVTLTLVSPLITTDRANKVNWLQYSSKQGRKILKKQFIAVLISSLGMTTILVIIFGGIFGTTEAQALWNNGINSFMSFPYHWLSITYGQYILLITGIIYLLSIGASAFAFVLSRLSQNVVKLMFKVIPLFVAAMLLSHWVLSEFLAIYLGGNIFGQMLAVVLLPVAGLISAAFVVRREIRAELR